MHPCNRSAAACTASFLFIILTLLLFTIDAEALVYGEDERVEVNMALSLPAYGIIEAVFVLEGSMMVEWSDPYPGPDGDLIDNEFSSILLNSPVDRIFIFCDACLCGGMTEWKPDPDFPAESFFDVMFELELPELIPGEIFHTEIPLHVSSFVTQWPPYWETYEMDAAVPLPIFNSLGDPVGEILFWSQEHMPYYPPTAHINAPMDKYSDVLVPIENEVPFVEVNANLITNVPCEILSATFGWRLAGSLDPFVDFGFDMDGSAPGFSTINEMGNGNGWGAVFDLNNLPAEGAEVEFEVDFDVGWPWHSTWRDTILGYGDPTFPLPGFWDWPTDSIGFFRKDSIYGIPVLYYDDWIAFRELRVLPLVPDHHRTLVPIDQLGLGTDKDSVSCGPTAAASCLKYWADNGYPEIEHPNGDTSKPPMTPEQIARELQGLMGTDSAGTTAGGMMDGIEDYLDNHGLDGWDVDGWYVDDAEDLAEMFEEFEADSEDVIILLQDTTASGDTIGHAVTMGSKSTSSYEVITDEAYIGCIRHNVDFMDPWGGGSTADNDYPVDYDENGQPTTSGYDLGGESGGAKIFGYIKVSPPEDGGGGGGSAMMLPAESDRWVQVDTGPGGPPGLPDTLYWNTAGFEGGVYLMEVRVQDAGGRIKRAIRLCGVPEYTVDTGENETPGARTMILGSYPNPFNPTTTIRFSLAKRTKVTIAVYDIAGRLVKRLLVDEMKEAGDHMAFWDGRNEAGSRAASGVYFCMMRTAEGTSGSKLILLR
jgi:hypothetical protein